MPFVVFLAAPGMEEMKNTFDNARMTSSLISSSRNLANFERNSSIRMSSRRAKTLESISSLYVEEDVMKNLEESARLHRAYAPFFDVVVVSENHDQTFKQVMQAWHQLSLADQWVPSSWVYS
jgi:nitric oxide reductase large subunit